MGVSEETFRGVFCPLNCVTQGNRDSHIYIWNVVSTSEIPIYMGPRVSWAVLHCPGINDTTTYWEFSLVEEGVQEMGNATNDSNSSRNACVPLVP